MLRIVRKIKREDLADKGLLLWLDEQFLTALGEQDDKIAKQFDKNRDREKEIEDWGHKLREDCPSPRKESFLYLQ